MAPPPTHHALFPFPPSHATNTTTDNDPISTAETIAPTSVVFRLSNGLFHVFKEKVVDVKMTDVKIADVKLADVKVADVKMAEKWSILT